MPSAPLSASSAAAQLPRSPQEDLPKGAPTSLAHACSSWVQPEPPVAVFSAAAVF